MWNVFFFIQSVNGDKHVRLSGIETKKRKKRKTKRKRVHTLYSTSGPNSSK